MWWLLFVASVSALGPVKDYRVASWETLDSWPFNHQKAASVALSGLATNVASSGSSVSTVSAAVPDSVPTVVLGSTVQALWTDSSNSIYYVNATIDDNNSGYSQVFPLLIDTGSGISWIYNTSCTSSACSNAPKFEDSGSIYTTSSFSLTYTGQTINGSLVDTLHNNLTYSFPDGLALANYSFGLATSAPSFFNDYNVSGIIGIPSKFDESVPTNFIAQLKATGSIDTRKFGLILGGSANSNSSFGGLLLFGDAASNNSKTLATSDLAYCSLDDNSHGYWLVTVSQLNVVDSDDNTHALSSFNSSRQAIIDTGTTGLSLPLADADALHTALFGSTLVSDNNGNYAFLCNATGEMDFIIGGHNFTIPVDNIRGSAYQNSVLSGYCASKVQGSTSSTFWVLGASFLKSFYTIFDLDNSKIGFAPCVESFATAAANEAPKISSTTLATSTTSMASSASNSTSTSHNNAALNAVGPFASLSSVVLALFCMLY